MNDKIMLPAMFEVAGAVYEAGKPDEKRDGKTWWLRAPETTLIYVVDRPECPKPIIGMGVV